MNKKIIAGIVGLAVAITGVVGFSPRTRYVEINSDQTAIVVPLDGAVDQQEKFKSMDAVKNMQVALKRVPVNSCVKWLGGLNFKRMDDVNVLAISRTPVSREWTKGTNGTSTVNQAFQVESESISYYIPVSITAQILEQDTYKYFYYYGQKELSSVLDTEVRQNVQGILTKLTAGVNMENSILQKGKFSETLDKDIKDEFAKRGINILNVSIAGQYEYDDASIQTAINERFKADKQREANVIKAQAEKEANDERNKQKLALKDTELKMAAKELDIAKLKKQAELEKQAAYTKAYLENKRIDAAIEIANTINDKIKIIEGNDSTSIVKGIYGLQETMKSVTPAK